MLSHPRCLSRPGFSLLEVLVALTIFLMALIVVGRLVVLAADMALEVEQQAQASQMCQSKMAEVVAGAEPLTAQGDMTFEEDPDWHWSMEAEQDSIPNLWNVRIRVWRTRADGSGVECVLQQLVFDPDYRGSSQDTGTAVKGTDQGGTTGTDQGQGSTGGTSSGGTGSSGQSGSGSGGQSGSGSGGSGNSSGSGSGGNSGGGSGGGQSGSGRSGGSR